MTKHANKTGKPFRLPIDPDNHYLPYLFERFARWLRRMGFGYVRYVGQDEKGRFIFDTGPE